MPSSKFVADATQSAASLCNALLDILFPRDCMMTGEPVKGNTPYQYFNRVSDTEMGIVKAPFCRTCGFPFFGDLAFMRMCPHCTELEPEFGAGRTCLLMQGVGREIIHEFKYNEGLHLLHDIRAIVRATPGFIDFLNHAIIVPVPLHPSKERQRGFNQARLLAKLFATEAVGARVENALQRVKYTETQTRLKHAARQKNMHGAFAAHKHFYPQPGTRYIVVDDVFTTGATVNACCLALKEVGASEIDIATLGHG